MSISLAIHKQLCLFVLLTSCHANFSQADDQQFQIAEQSDRLVIRFGEQPIAHYVFADKNIPRPYFAHVKTLSGIQATRNHPPIEGQDRTDHDTMHPGIWMAFGDLDGADFWRNKATIAHQKFHSISSHAGHVEFQELKHYLRANGDFICREDFTCRLQKLEQGILLEWDSTFSSDRDFYFGDQEEMGLGFRVATPVSEIQGGKLKDSTGRIGANEIWSHAADWCDYSGTIDGQTVGITIFSHPGNFRQSWLHARNYGFVAANPFGRKAMHKGDSSRVVVKTGDTLRLRYGIFIRSQAPSDEVDLNQVYGKYRTSTTKTQ